MTKPRDWIRRFLGLTDLQRKVDNITIDILNLNRELKSFVDSYVAIRAELTSLFRNEFDPIRQKASEELGRRTIERLLGEDKARRHSTGEL